MGSDLLRSVALLIFLNTGTSALPNRTSAVRFTQYESPGSNNDTVGINNPELIAKLQDNNGRWWLGGEIGPLCAYRTLSAAGNPAGRLCFRYTQPDFTCPAASCRQVTSPGGQLTANILSNSSVFVQWTSTAPTKSSAPGQTGGFRLSCWWNGSYTQFDCAGVHLGSSCRDYLLNELHTNVPYRLCVRPYASERPEACVEFSFAPGGMQDIVIAMTTVGGAICVMLVIICLLVAYITENIMNPTAQHTLTAQHSHRSHLNTHL